METPELAPQTFVAFEDFKLRQSIWENIEKLVRCLDERNEIKKIIGQSLIDETLDLHTELLTLYGIWKEYHEETNNLVCKKPIPEPPLLRENLEKQISMMVRLLQSKLAKQGNRSISAFLTDEEKVMIKSVSAGSKSASSRRHSTVSNVQQQQKVISGECSQEETSPVHEYDSRCSSALSVDLDCLQESINVLDIDAIAQPLREDFQDERRLLLDDIAYIQSAMIFENEHHVREKQEMASSPTIKDLRKLTVKLEKEILIKEDGKQFHEIKSNASAKKHGLAPLSPSSPTSSKKKSSCKTSRHKRELIATAAIDFPTNATNSRNSADKKSCRRETNTQVPFHGNEPYSSDKLIPSPPCTERNDRTTTAGNLRKTINMRKLAEGTVG